MKHRYLALFIAMIASTPAFAAPVVMVQFGSFETQQEAQKRLDDLKSANASVLSGISPTVREVKLPPDNLTVYRTQAGPLESRAAAQSLCNKLASSGSECYVVETAVNSSTPASSAVAAAPVAVKAAEVAKVEPAKIPEQLGAIAPTTVGASTASPELQSAMDRAAAIQDAGEVSAPVAVAPTEKPTFWSRLNPFSSTPEVKPVPKPVVVAEKLPVAAPVTEVSSSSLVAPVAVAAVAVPTINAHAFTAEPAAPVAVAPSINAAPALVASSDLRPRLLPPPAPLTEKDKQILENTPAPVQVAKAAVIPAPVPVAIAPVSSPVVEMPAYKPEALTLAATTPAGGSVQVEEAKRVPVTESPRPIIRSTQTTTTRVIVPPAVNPLPASTLGQRTLWAQVGHFNNSEAALEFWDSYRNAHPDFPSLRVRVVSSMQQQQHGNQHVWLRVGPFYREGFVTSLCNSLNKTDKRCGQITDVGIAAKTSFTQTGYLQGSRYKR